MQAKAWCSNSFVMVPSLSAEDLPCQARDKNGWQQCRDPWLTGSGCELCSPITHCTERIPADASTLTRPFDPDLPRYQWPGKVDAFIWQFVDGRTRHNRWRNLKQSPASTVQSDAMSKALRAHGFKFTGSTICYAYMQAAGLVNDHVTGCYRHDEIRHIAS